MTDQRHRRVATAALFTWALFFAQALFFAGTSSAAVYCQTDDQCPDGTICSGDRCVLESTTNHSPVDPGADDECGADRRCRIRRLARKNRARRKIRAIREEQALESLIERTQRRREEEINRHADPWTLDLASSYHHEAGLMAGYAITPQIKAEIAAFWPSYGVYTSVGDINIDGQAQDTLFSLGPTYYFGESFVVPYARAAFMYGTGEFRTYGMYNSGDGRIGTGDTGMYGSRATLATETHALLVGGGVDVQFDVGFHMRLGLNYRMLLFNEASIRTGEYDDTVRKALEDEFYPLDIVFLIGWAF